MSHTYIEVHSATLGVVGSFSSSAEERIVSSGLLKRLFSCRLFLLHLFAFLFFICPPGLVQADSASIQAQENSFSSRICQASWNNDPSDWLLVSHQGKNADDYLVISDGAGGVFVVWKETANIYAQRLDKCGYSLWPAGGIEISSSSGDKILTGLCQAGNEGIYIVWLDDYSKQDFQYDIYYTKVALTGKNSYPQGKALCTAKGVQDKAVCIPDNQGGLAVVWQDERNGWQNSDIYLQQIDNKGLFRYGAEGRVICQDSGRQVNPRVFIDAGNDLIILWEEKTVKTNFYLQKVLSNAAFQFSAPGKLIYSTDSQLAEIADVIYGNDSSVYLAWTENTSGTNHITGKSIYLQQMTFSAGTDLTINKIELVAEKGIENDRFRLLAVVPGGVVVSWIANNRKICLRKIAETGEIVWQTTIGETNNQDIRIYDYDITTDSNGGAIFIWQQGYETADGVHTEIYTQCVNEKGELQWNLSGLPLAVSSGSPSKPRVVSDNNDGLIAFFTCPAQETTEGGSRYWESLYSQNVTSSGRLGMSSAWFLPEGCTRGFDEWLSIMNPTAKVVPVTVTFITEAGKTSKLEKSLKPYSRCTIYVNEYLPGQTFGTVVTTEDNSPLVVERIMYWSADGNKWIGGHCGQGITNLSNKWYFPEGNTTAFSEWILILNPGTEPAKVAVRFILPDGKSVREQVTVNPLSRLTLPVNRYITASDVSVELSSDKPVAAERSMYWTSGTEYWVGGHVSSGITELYDEWYLAEGSTKGFYEWVLLMNPHDLKAKVTAIFMEPDGKKTVKEYEINPASRFTINVNDIITEKSVSVWLLSDLPLAVERAMYWDSGEIPYIDGHVSSGVNAPSLQWDLAEGFTGNGFDEWIVILNPYKESAEVLVTLLNKDGKAKESTISINGTSNYALHINDLVPDDSVSAKVVSSNRVPIIVERAMYWNSGQIKRSGGHVTAGMR